MVPFLRQKLYFNPYNSAAILQNSMNETGGFVGEGDLLFAGEGDLLFAVLFFAEEHLPVFGGHRLVPLGHREDIIYYVNIILLKDSKVCVDNERQ
jgi:hypothetical protein